MKILSINAGSSSLKYKLYNNKIIVLAEGLIEKIGEDKAIFCYKKGNFEINENYKVDNHQQGLKLAVNHLLDKDFGVVGNINEIKMVGHRVVHGKNLSKSTLIDKKTITHIKKCSDLAPLHNPANLKGIEIAKKIFKKAKQIAVFDTAFHQTIPEENFIYPLPYNFYQKQGIRKYGFHGISHQYLTGRAAEMLKNKISNLNLITCHLGAGCSMTAIKNGKSFDTSMGFTPTAGLMMATRSGDIDPGVITYLSKKLKIKTEEIEDILNHQSGLLGVSGVSRDMRDILAKARGNKRCKLALEIFANKAKKYLGSYVASLGKVDAVIFSGGIGARSDAVRKMICENLDSLGIKIDSYKNKKAFEIEKDISTRGSKIKTLIIPTDEEKMIAIEVKKFV